MGQKAIAKGPGPGLLSPMCGPILVLLLSETWKVLLFLACSPDPRLELWTTHSPGQRGAQHLASHSISLAPSSHCNISDVFSRENSRWGQRVRSCGTGALPRTLCPGVVTCGMGYTGMSVALEGSVGHVTLSVHQGL